MQKLLETERGEREFAKEELAFEATELIAELMEKKHVSKTELAQRIGKSKAYVTQVLSGSRNITMHTLAGLTFALGYKAKLAAAPRAEAPGENQHRTIEAPAAGRRLRG